MTLHSSRADLFIVGERIVLSAQVWLCFCQNRFHNSVGSRGAKWLFFVGMDGPVVFFKAMFY